ncbi:TonB-dependent receptor [Thalassotalea sp. PS06]|uniref:TonB-dependent receptor n=1 Tax=Thalassotalea sp. PS06 TaxID=2594005 RepID=UPI001164B836|nr:TonB-dependent receptor [Thalassotalea sp. PS06]QDP00466.1 TonB-dependent receptor [Thalassotalea sp. PS06]
MTNLTFKKSKLATTLSIVLGATTMASAGAEENTASVEEEVEVIEVTGIRGSLTKSMDIKRSAKGIVEAINAEDIGKFPDTNLAESLQRITGVAIDRDNGEGSRVTVRGFGPDRNLVLLNGRQMPTSTGGRSFDFDNIASELVTGAEIYKSSDATIATGGIGATINILTHRPLNTPGLKATVGVKAMDDSSTLEGGVTPELSGLYSNTFLDDKFGISISGSYAERESGSQQAEVGTGWRSFPARINQDWSGGNADWGGVPYENQIDRPDPSLDDSNIYSVPQTTAYRFEEQQRTRINGQLVLQYEITEDFVATVDYTYMTNEIDRQFNDVSAWYQFFPSENVWTEAEPGVFSPLYYSEDYGDAIQDFSMGGSVSGVKAESNSIGLNLAWQVNENLSLEFDYHSSDAEETPNSPYGSSNVLSTAAFIREASATDFTGTIPTLAVRGSAGLTPADMQLTGGFFRNDDNRSEIDQAQLSGTYELDEFGSIDFGINMMTANKTNLAVQVQRDEWGGVGNAGDIPAEFFPEQSIQDKFDDVSGGNFENHPTMSADEFEIVDTFYMWDFESVLQYARDNYAMMVDPAIAGDCGTLYCPSTNYARDTNRFVEEEIMSYYVQWNYDGEIGDMPFDVHIGLRYEETEIFAESAVLDYTGATARWVGSNETVFAQPEGNSQIFLSQKGDYDHLLPNFNFNLEVTDDIILRAAYSETIGRADYSQLQGGTTVATLYSAAGADGNSGNPDLLPLESTNYDLSAEWYYDESSYVALGWFQKDVKNWIGQDRGTAELFGIYDPRNGPKVDAARAAGAGDDAAIRQYIFDNFSDNPEVYMDGGQIVIEGVPGDDLLTFNTTTPGNSDFENTFDGWEFAIQHVFWDTGFGAFANFTIVDAGDDYNNRILVNPPYDNTAVVGDTNDGVQEGISDTANFVLFYEKYGISARLAYNWRDDYLEATGNGAGAHPVYVEEYEQFDFNVSYTFQDLEGLSIFVEGINITEEYRRKHGRSEYQVLNVYQQGARYSIGARYVF